MISWSTWGSPDDDDFDDDDNDDDIEMTEKNNIAVHFKLLKPIFPFLKIRKNLETLNKTFQVSLTHKTFIK